MLRIFAAAIAGLLAFSTASAAEPPHLKAQGEAVQLIVDGKPFLIRGGELGNSTASGLDYLDAQWATLEALNLNTVLAPVSWEMIEPEEGQFDFAIVDGLLAQARAHDMKLVILWFGVWKNSMSTYVPGWVKRDDERFPRTKDDTGRSQEILTPFSEELKAADAAAFAALMKHLKKVDSRENTVLMMQVENEIGMLPVPRDYSALAEDAWTGPVPQALMDYLTANRATLQPELNQLWGRAGFRASGTWAEVFGDDPHGEEVFIAWYFAQFASDIAAAGAAEYDLPMYVNVALNRPGRLPGEYPSGGPLPHLLDIWKAGGPALDFLAPDIYFSDFTKWVSRYDIPGNAVFIPEANRPNRPQALAEALYAYGGLDAIGFSPFSIESFDDPAEAPLAELYAVIEELAPMILARQGTDMLHGLKPAVSHEGEVDYAPHGLQLGDFPVEVSFVDPWSPAEEQAVENNGLMVLELGPNDFLFVGKGATITFREPAANGGIIGIETAIEGTFEDGVWKPGRWMNGDQTHQGRHIRLPSDHLSMQRVSFYTYE